MTVVFYVGLAVVTVAAVLGILVVEARNRRDDR